MRPKLVEGIMGLGEGGRSGARQGYASFFTRGFIRPRAYIRSRVPNALRPKVVTLKRGSYFSSHRIFTSPSTRLKSLSPVTNSALRDFANAAAKQLA